MESREMVRSSSPIALINLRSIANKPLITMPIALHAGSALKQ
jgi:hypothetical protein